MQGFMTNETGALSTRLTDVRIETNSIPPQATKTLRLDLNLDAREKVLEDPFDLNRPGFDVKLQ